MPIRWQQSKQSVDAKQLSRLPTGACRRRPIRTALALVVFPHSYALTTLLDAIPTGTRRRRPIPRHFGRIPAMVCAVNACASVRLAGRSYLSHSSSHVLSASRRERDGVMQFQPSAAQRYEIAVWANISIQPCGSIILAPSYASEHYRNNARTMPTKKPILQRDTERICVFEMPAAVTIGPRLGLRLAALAGVRSLTVSDPTATSVR